jgi:1,4-alpha-glucan branching enzyme
MLQKTFTPKRTVCKVKFSIPADWATESAALCGDFNNWDTSSHKMVKKNGSWNIELRLQPSKTYQFKYLCDADWKNDDQADQYLENDFGTVNSVLVIED